MDGWIRPYGPLFQRTEPRQAGLDVNPPLNKPSKLLSPEE